MPAIANWTTTPVRTVRSLTLLLFSLKIQAIVRNTITPSTPCRRMKPFLSLWRRSVTADDVHRAPLQQALDSTLPIKKRSIIRPKREDNLQTIFASDRRGADMSKQRTRREILKGSLAVAGWSVFGIPEWVIPALAQGETVVPFTDWPANFNPNPAVDRRNFDT